ncbi:MAG: hypothetical protein M3492_02135 [Actinomycetota bacterium]|nr:hypothetical protein [Actinomycetota bacterium]
MTNQPQYPGQPFQPPSPYVRLPQRPAQPQGPPPNATAGRSSLWLVAVAVLALAVVGASYWLGAYLGLHGRTWAGG